MRPSRLLVSHWICEEASNRRVKRPLAQTGVPFCLSIFPRNAIPTPPERTRPVSISLELPAASVSPARIRVPFGKENFGAKARRTPVPVVADHEPNGSNTVESASFAYR